MKKILTILLAGLGSVSAILHGTAIAQNPPDKSHGELTFQDEFDNTNLDKNHWIDHYAGYRTSPERSLANFAIEDKILKLRIDVERPLLYSANPKSEMRVSSIQTAQLMLPSESKDHDEPNIVKFSQQYGWFEIRCRMPSGSGLNCSFWLQPSDVRYMHLVADGGTRASENEPYEIDIFEQLGRDPHANQFNVHFGDSYKIKHKQEPHHFKSRVDFSQDFHVWALEWSKKEMIWYLDGEEVHRCNKVPHAPFFLYVGIYEGAGWTGPVDRNIAYPRDYEIDYVRVYRKRDLD